MNFQDLHELLRLEVLRRIASGGLTGTRLAQQTGFRQAHISNFLNRKRALSLEGLDRVLASQELTVEQITPLEIAAAEDSSMESAPPHDEVTVVPIVSATVAAEEATIRAADVMETLPLAASRLSDNRVRPAPRTAAWQRFVALWVDAEQAAAMQPALASGMIAVIDRHYNSLAPYRAHRPTLFAVRSGTGLLLRHVEYAEGRLILRPSAMEYPVQLISIAENKLPSDYIVGRVCLLMNEL